MPDSSPTRSAGVGPVWKSQPQPFTPPPAVRKVAAAFVDVATARTPDAPAMAMGASGDSMTGPHDVCAWSPPQHSRSPAYVVAQAHSDGAMLFTGPPKPPRLVGG